MHPQSPSTDRPGGDTGSAALEFVLVGTLLLVPLVYLIVALGAIQGQTLGVEAGARHIARAVSLSPDVEAANTRAVAVRERVLADYGVDRAAARVIVDCRPAGGACPRAGAVVVVTVTAQVALPLVPPVLGLDRLAAVTVQASSVQRMSRLWGGP